MPLPANTIKLYDRNGQLVGRLLYQGNGVVYQPCDPAPQDGDSFTDPEQPTVEGTSDHSHLILTQGSHLASSATCTHSLPDPALSLQFKKKAHLKTNVYLRPTYHQHKRITLHPVILKRNIRSQNVHLHL